MALAIQVEVVARRQVAIVAEAVQAVAAIQVEVVAHRAVVQVAEAVEVLVVQGLHAPRDDN